MPGEGVGRERRGLELERAVDEDGQLGGAELGAGQEMASFVQGWGGFGGEPWRAVEQLRGPASAGVYGGGVALRVVSWNLMHGRAVPPAGRYLEEEFIAALDRWEWDVALLQEVPPWWPQILAARLDIDQRFVLTSRNGLLSLRRALAIRWPDAMKSNGGGANAILVRHGTILEHRRLRLCRLPERRWVHAVRLAGVDGPDAAVWAANLHLTSQNHAAAASETGLAAEALLEWAAGIPAVLGGDFNLPSPSAPGFTYAGGHGVDHFLLSGLRAVGEPDLLVRGLLSDHAPVALDLVFSRVRQRASRRARRAGGRA